MNTKSKTVLLQGTPYALGIDTAISVGYSMKGNRVITKCVICSDEENNFYVISGGIEIKIKPEDLKDFYHNTSANRELLKQLIADGKA